MNYYFADGSILMRKQFIYGRKGTAFITDGCNQIDSRTYLVSVCPIRQPEFSASHVCHVIYHVRNARQLIRPVCNNTKCSNTKFHLYSYAQIANLWMKKTAPTLINVENILKRWFFFDNSHHPV